MDGSFDRASPRRGSLSSLHRQPMGSFSPGSKLASPSGSLQTTGSSLNSLYKDLDKFSRYFIIKAVQVIVQSRVDAMRKMKTDCKPGGNDWFNINIADIAEISDKTKAALESECLSVKSNWRVCCEISLKTNDGGRVVLEHWIISNKSLLNSGQKLNINQASPKSHHNSSRFSTNLLSTSNNVIGPLGNLNTASAGRVRPANGSPSSRTRLNSIDDVTGDNNFAANKLLMGANNENLDIKASTSCFSLSTTSGQHQVQETTTQTTMPSSPSVSSLSNNAAQSQATGQSSTSQGIKSSAMSSIYTIYNRMSLLLKTIMTTTHIVPAYRLASRKHQSESCVLCYRVYVCSPSNQSVAYNLSHPRGSIEDVSFHSESPNRRSLSSNSSFGSINIREFVGPDELDHFCPILKVGSVKTEVNQLDVSLCYRTDIRSSGNLIRSPHSKDMYNRMLDEDCITAAKQLLAGRNANGSQDNSQDSSHCDTPGNHPNNFQDNSKDDPLGKTQGNAPSSSQVKGLSSGRKKSKIEQILSKFDVPIDPPFACKKLTAERLAQDPNLQLIETAFDKLLDRYDAADEDLVKVASDIIKKQADLSKPTTMQTSSSNPMPSTPLSPKSQARSKMEKLLESFELIDLDIPFANNEQNDLKSFFHGPAPSFSQGLDKIKNAEDITNQIADIEASASQFDDFVDNICVSEDEESEH